MARPSATKLARVAYQGLQTARAARVILPSVSTASTVLSPQPRLAAPPPARRFISSSTERKGITPDNKPRDLNNVETPKVAQTPADMTDSDYHTVADEYLERLLTHLEELQDSREDVDVEYSVR